MVVLENVCLCAIVRDEMMNPAGGIERFIHSHVPFVKKAVIQDTGSIDGTYDKLKDLQKTYSNLIIPNPIKFEGYANARNTSLKYADTEYILVLDADELITHKKPKNDFLKIKKILRKNKSIPGYLFDFWVVSEDIGEYPQYDCHFLRLFRRDKNFLFYGDVGEWIPSQTSDCKSLDISIKHFIGNFKSTINKHSEWYDDFNKNLKKGISPSQTPNFKKWKTYNSKRDNYE